MSLKVIIVEENPDIRDMLKIYLESKGYQVMAFSDQENCPFFSGGSCSCSAEQACADAIILQDHPRSPLAFKLLDELSQKGCRLKNSCKAVISTNIERDYREILQQRGYSYFSKPFRLAEIHNWLQTCQLKACLAMN
jgi:DNA-binding response OmpR family regulator